MTMQLRTIKKASQETGASTRFLHQLITEGKLTRYKVNSATYVSLTEFESIAKPIRKADIKRDLLKADTDTFNGINKAL